MQRTVPLPENHWKIQTGAYSKKTTKMSAVVPRKVVYVQVLLQESLINNSEPKTNLFTLEKMGK